MNSSDAKGTSTDSRGSYLRHIRLEHLYAGVSGGVISTLVLHPLDLVKIRFQGETNDDKQFSFRSSNCYIWFEDWKGEGSFRTTQPKSIPPYIVRTTYGSFGNI